MMKGEDDERNKETSRDCKMWQQLNFENKQLLTYTGSHGAGELISLGLTMSMIVRQM